MHTLKFWLRLAAFVALSFVAPAAPASADPPPGEPTVSGEVADIEPGEASTPAGAVRAFLAAARARDYEDAARHMAFSSGVADAEKPRLARELKVVLDRKLWIDPALVSSHPTGDLDDGLAPRLERLGAIDGQDILLERGAGGWKFSRTTVSKISGLHERHGYGRLGEILPAPMFEISFLEVQLWQWAGLGLLVLAAWLVSWLVTRLVVRLLRPVVARTATTFDDELLRVLAPPFRYGVALALLAVGSLSLALSLPAYTALTNVLKGLGIVVATWLGVRAIDIAASTVVRHLEQIGKRGVIAIVPLGARVAKVFLSLIALVVALQNLGFNVTGLIAGLGVGGLAVALAAQKSVANLFGGVSLIADQPVRVGDQCRFGGSSVGTVEEIGLRSTRVRTIDRTLVTIPNAEFSEMQLENFAERDRIRLQTVLGLRYETSPDQLRAVLAQIRQLLVDHPKVGAAPEPRARLVNFGAHSLDVEIFAYVETREVEEFLVVREDLFLRIIDVVHAGGSGFAFPSQTLYLGRDRGLSPVEVGS